MKKVKGVYCSECNQKIRNIHEPCPVCGSENKRIYASCNAIMKTFSNIGKMKNVTYDKDGKKKKIWTYESKYMENYFDPESTVHRVRVYDFPPFADHYLETVTDVKTGEEIHRCDEPLTDHKNHGSAKKRKYKNTKGKSK